MPKKKKVQPREQRKTTQAKQKSHRLQQQGVDDPNPELLDHLGAGIVEEQKRLQPETAKLLNSLRDGRIFFYPACDKDWNPLHRFTHLCDTFVYCDYNAQDAEFGDCHRLMYDRIPQGVGLEVRRISNLHAHTVTELAAPDGQPDDFPNVVGAWGKAIELIRHIGDQQRNILLLYFRAEGVTLYRNLFNKRSIAPRVICLKQCGDGFGGQNWTTFTRWNGPLGRAVWENRDRPEFIVSAYYPPDYDWPWCRVWQEHRNWRSDLSQTLTSFVLPSALPAPGGAPQRRGGIVAADVNMRDVRNRTIVRIKPPPYVHTNIPNGEPVMSLQREEAQSLEVALRNLRRDCAQPEIANVHSIGCHFEDEAPALSAWKWRTTTPRTLTIHCESEGDLACYGPAADEVMD